MIFTSNQIDKYNQLLADPKISNRHVIPLTPDVVRVCYRKKKEYIKENKNSNVHLTILNILNIYILDCIGRIYNSHCPAKLIRELEKCEVLDRCAVIYCDTDSVAVRHPKGCCPLDEGIFLGQVLINVFYSTCFLSI